MFPETKKTFSPYEHKIEIDRHCHPQGSQSLKAFEDNGTVKGLSQAVFNSMIREDMQSLENREVFPL